MELDQRLADVDGEHVGRAEQGEADERQFHRARQAEDDRRRAERRHRSEHLEPDLVLQGAEGKIDGGQRRAERRRGAQMAEAGGAGVEDIAREHRQHRRRAPEQDREQIERDRPQHELVAAHVAKPVDHLVPGMLRAFDRGSRLRPDHEHAQQRQREQAGRDRIGRGRRPGVEIAAERGPDDRSGLPGDRAHRDRLWQYLARDEVGREGLQGRHGEGARHAEQGGDGEEYGKGDRALPGAPAKDARAEQFERDRRPGDEAPVEPVGGPACHQRKREQRNELDDSDETELERGGLQIHGLAGDVVDLPADDDHGDHLRDRRGQPGHPVETEIANGEGRARLHQAAVRPPGGRLQHRRRDICGRPCWRRNEIPRKSAWGLWGRGGCDEAWVHGFAGFGGRFGAGGLRDGTGLASAARRPGRGDLARLHGPLHRSGFPRQSGLRGGPGKARI